MPETKAKESINYLARLKHQMAMKPGKRCVDYDSECVDVPNPFKCWCYQPERGYCPMMGQGDA